jgi:hypothetical protein
MPIDVGRDVPTKKWRKPPAFGPRMSGLATPGPHACIDVDTPAAAGPTSSRTVELPGSTRPYERSPKR